MNLDGFGISDSQKQTPGLLLKSTDTQKTTSSGYVLKIVAEKVTLRMRKQCTLSTRLPVLGECIRARIGKPSLRKIKETKYSTWALKRFTHIQHCPDLVRFA